MVDSFSTVEGDNLISSKYTFMGTLNQRQRRYCAKIVSTLFVKYGTDTQSSLLKFWITRIVSDNILGNILESCNTEFPLEFLPKSLKVSRISKTLSDTFLTRCRSTKEQKKHGILYMISVVKKQDSQLTVMETSKL